MSTLWNKTLFYLGLVDEGQEGPPTVDSPGGAVRPVPLDPSGTLPPSGQVVPGDGQRVASVARPGTGVVGRRVEPPAATRQRMSDDRRHAEAGVYIHPGAGSASAPPLPTRRMEPEAHIIAAKNFSDAQTLADSIQMGRSVLLDLRSTEPEMVRRIVDFASGLTYALDGKMVKTTQGVILVTPSGVAVGQFEQDRLVKLGLFDEPN